MATKRTFIGNIKGPQGETGATGAQGPVGPGATIEVGTVSTTAYGNTAQVVNSGTETAAVLDFVIPQGKPGEQTTKMGALTLDTITAQSAEYPIPAVGDTGATAFGKIVKFFNDVKTAVNSKINISDIVNNLTSTATNKPLSAAQGKALNDALGNKVNSTDLSGFRIIWDTTYANYDLAGVSGAKIIRLGLTSSNSALISFEISWVKIQFIYAQSTSTKLRYRIIYGQSVGDWTEI